MVPEINYELGAAYILLPGLLFFLRTILIFKMCIDAAHFTYMLMLIVKLFTVNGSRYSTSFCISAMLSKKKLLASIAWSI